jgi:iron complex transport system permease protein
MRKIKPATLILLLIGILLLSVFTAITNGALNISIKQIFQIIGCWVGLPTKADFSDEQYAVMMVIRLPRIVFGIFIGATLAICGAAIQGLFRNPLADAGLVGISSGASLAAVLTIVLASTVSLRFEKVNSLFGLSIMTFVGAFASTLLVFRLSQNRGKIMTSTMLLAGIAITALTSAITGTIILYANDAQLRSITFWTMGSLGGATWRTVSVLVPLTLIPILLLPYFGKSLNALSLGENNAAHMGINTERMKTCVTLLIALGVGVSVSVAGIIGFVGLVIPHLVRMLIGPEHRNLMIVSGLLGASALTIADVFCRTVIAPAEIPIGISTALLGSPFFLYLVTKDKTKYDFR